MLAEIEGLGGNPVLVRLVEALDQGIATPAVAAAGKGGAGSGEGVHFCRCQRLQ